MANRLPSITIIRDTREKEGWVFDPEEKVAGKIQILGTEVDTLQTGDYTIKGMESIVVIERKNGVSELFGNYSPVEHKIRFEKEIQRMNENIKHKYIIVESVLSNDLLSMSVPQMKYGPPAKRIVDWLSSLSIKYGVHVIFAGDCGKYIARSIFENIARSYD